MTPAGKSHVLSKNIKEIRSKKERQNSLRGISFETRRLTKNAQGISS